MIKGNQFPFVFLIVIGLATGTHSFAAQDVLEDQYFDSNGVRIRYVEKGSGEPVILGHGSTGSIEGGWIETGVFEALANDYRVIAFDQRGHGRSDKPHEPSAYGLEIRYDIVRLLDHLGIEKAHIVGYAMGAQAVAQLLTISPERFLTATLGATPPRRTWGPEDEEAARQDAERRRTSAALIASGQDTEALAALTLARAQGVVSDESLSRVQVPALAIVGSDDPRLAAINDLKMVMTDLEIVVIEGATHWGDNKAPARPEFVAAIREFIARHDSENLPRRVWDYLFRR